MTSSLLGQEIRRLRLQAGLSLRGLGTRLQTSAAHLSDIEHDHRRPSAPLLRKIAFEFRGSDATFESLELLLTGLDPETLEWAAATPGVRALLRRVRKSGRDPHHFLDALDALDALDEVAGRDGTGKRRKAHGSGGDPAPAMTALDLPDQPGWTVDDARLAAAVTQGYR